MQRIGNLFSEFCCFQNLYTAWLKTRKGSGRTLESARFFFQMERELLELKAAFQSEEWQPRPFRHFDIYDPKHRTIAVADYRDRVVHHALVNVLEPIFEKVFITDSFATRKEKGVHAAVFRAQYFLKGNEHYFKSDIEKFFDSVCHDRLLDIIARKIKDAKLLTICEKIIRHGGCNGRGLPIGNRTSQFFANVYLDPFDHYIKDHLGIQAYVRYMDDFVVFENEKQRLKDLRKVSAEFLREKLLLELKPSATFMNGRQNGLPFLGRRIFPGIIRLRSENLRRITRRITVKEQLFLDGCIDEVEFLHSMNSYWAMLSYYPELYSLRRALLRT